MQETPAIIFTFFLQEKNIGLEQLHCNIGPTDPFYPL